MMNKTLSENKLLYMQELRNRARTAHLRQGPQQALLSYGPTEIMKDRVVRNFDHLEIYKEVKKIEFLKE